MRDVALAAAVGVISGADFGGEFGTDFGDDDYGGDFGDDYGADAPAAAVATPTVPRFNPAQAAQLWVKHHRGQANTQRRASILDPNRGSNIKVERYSFNLNQNLVIGTASPVSITKSPDVTFRPQRTTVNAPTPGFVLIAEIKVANVSVTMGDAEDAYNFSSLGVGQSLDMPTLTPSNRASVLGNYTGFTPPGYVGGSAYTLNVNFKGPASVVA